MADGAVDVAPALRNAQCAQIAIAADAPAFAFACQGQGVEILDLADVFRSEDRVQRLVHGPAIDAVQGIEAGRLAGRIGVTNYRWCKQVTEDVAY